MGSTHESDDANPASGPRIKVSKDGPYCVSGGLPLKTQIIESNAVGVAYAWRGGEAIAAGERYALCRCGQSAKKPFCDGKHDRVGFDGSETAPRYSYLHQAETVEGPNLRLTDVPKLCAGARFCERAGGTWDLTKESTDPEARATAIQEAADCPSGRLVAWSKQGNPLEPVLTPHIGVVQDPFANVDGPLWVQGGIPIESADGVTYEVRNRATLCRCGKSGNKPWCDGGHLRK